MQTYKAGCEAHCGLCCANARLAVTLETRGADRRKVDECRDDGLKSDMLGSRSWLPFPKEMQPSGIANTSKVRRSLDPCTLTVLSKNGRRNQSLSPPLPQIVPPPRPPPQPGHIPHRTREHIDDMAQSKRSATASREDDHTRQNQHRSQQTANPQICLRTCAPSSESQDIPHPNHSPRNSNPTNTSPNSLAP